MFVSDEEELITTPKKIEKKESCAAALEKGKDGFVQRYLSQNTGGRNKNAIAKRLTLRKGKGDLGIFGRGRKSKVVEGLVSESQCPSRNDHESSPVIIDEEIREGPLDERRPIFEQNIFTGTAAGPEEPDDIPKHERHSEESKSSSGEDESDKDLAHLFDFEQYTRDIEDIGVDSEEMLPPDLTEKFRRSCHNRLVLDKGDTDSEKDPSYEEDCNVFSFYNAHRLH